MTPARGFQEKIQVDESMTRKMADLARLELTDQEVTTFTHQLGDILKYIDLLQEVDVTNVEPLTHPLELKTPMREDEVKPSPVDADGNPRVLESGPEVMDGGFRVPQIL